MHAYLSRRCGRQLLQVVHLAFFIVVLLVVPYAAAAERVYVPPRISADDAILGLRSSLESLSSVEATFRTYFKDFSYPGAERVADDLYMYSEFQWGWERSSRREYQDGKWGYENAGRVSYVKAHFAFDGSILKSFDLHSGKIASVGTTFLEWRNPLVLNGLYVGFIEPRSLLEVLSEPEIEVNENKYILTSEYTDGKEEMLLTVWLDSEHGMMPSRIETRRKTFARLDRLFETDKFAEPSPGVWLPTVGRVTFFTSDVVPPAGIDNDAMLQMPPEERERTLAKFQVTTRPLGRGTQHYIVDESTIKVNHRIDDHRFSPPFPPEILIWDDIKQQSFRIPAALTTQPVSNRSWRWWSLIVVNLIFLAMLVICPLISRWRRHATSGGVNSEHHSDAQR